MSLLPHSSPDLVVCLIPLHYGIFASPLFLDFSVGVGAFVIGLSRISFSSEDCCAGNQQIWWPWRLSDQCGLVIRVPGLY